MIGIPIRPSLKQGGSYVIWVMVLLPVLIGILAFSFDAGIAMIDQQRARTAADAAALSGAFAVQRDLPHLRSADATVKALALARVVSAARETAAANGFTHGTDGVVVTVDYPPSDEQSIYYSIKLADTEEVKKQKEIYVGVTVSRPLHTEFAHFLVPQSKLDELTISATAVGRAGTRGYVNSCPGLYMYGGGMNNKVLDLGQGSHFLVQDGGIFINDIPGGGTALFGSGGTMTGEWIEKSVNAGETGSVNYICTEYPEGTPCPLPVSSNRYEPDPPPPVTCTSGPSGNSQCCIKSGKKSCGVPRDTCISANTNTWTQLNPPLELRAGDYCNGLTVIGTGSVASPLLLKPSATTNRFNLGGSNMFVSGSYIRARVDPAYDYEGVTIHSYYDPDNPPPAPGAGRLEIGSNTKDSRSTLEGNQEGKLRVYFDAIWLNNHPQDVPLTLLSIVGFDEAGCGTLEETNTLVVQ